MSIFQELVGTLRVLLRSDDTTWVCVEWWSECHLVCLCPSARYITSSNVSNCQRDILHSCQSNQSSRISGGNARTPTPAMTLFPMGVPG